MLEGGFKLQCYVFLIAVNIKFFLECLNYKILGHLPYKGGLFEASLFAVKLNVLPII